MTLKDSDKEMSCPFALDTDNDWESPRSPRGCLSPRAGGPKETRMKRTALLETLNNDLFPVKISLKNKEGQLDLRKISPEKIVTYLNRLDIPIMRGLSCYLHFEHDLLLIITQQT